MNGASEFGGHEYGATRRELEQSGVGNRLRAVLGDGYDGTRRSNSNGSNSLHEDTLGRTRARGGYDDRSRGEYEERAQRGRGAMDYDRQSPRDSRDRFGESSRGHSSSDRDYFSTQDRNSLLPPKPSDSVTRLRAGNINSFNTSSSFDSGR